VSGGAVLWRELLGEATERLAAAGVESADVEARRIVVAAAGCDDSAWHSELDRPATRRGVAAFDRMLGRRAAGEPLQYVVGSWGFRTLDLFVDPRVLIPRPETEIVAGCALDELQRRADALQSTGRGGPGGGGAEPLCSSTQAKVSAARPPAPDASSGAGGGSGVPLRSSTRGEESSRPGPPPPPPRVSAPGEMLLAADLGCGSGAIGLSLAAERVDVEVFCTDVSADALAVASANLAGLGRPARRVRLAEGSWFEALPVEARGRLDVIVSNPPYIAEGGSLPAEITDHEPPVALYSGETGLEATSTVLAGAPEWLAPGGAVVLELADGTAGRVRELAGTAGLADVAVHPDLNGVDRVLVARRPT